MKTATFTGILAVALLINGLSLPSATAADDPLPKGLQGRAFARELDLSREQRDALQTIVRTHQPVLRPLREQARTERAGLRDLIAAPTLDEAALATQANRMAATHQQIVVASARMRAEMRKILTTEQLTKIDERRGPTKPRARGDRARFRW